MKREANRKRANRMFSLLLALTLCTAPVSGGAAVYAADADGGESISGVTAPETAVGDGGEEATGQETPSEPNDGIESEEENGQEITGQEPEGGLQSEAPGAGDPMEEPVEEQIAAPVEELTEAASLQADLLAEETTDWIDYADSTWTVDQPVMDAADLAQMAVLAQTQTFGGITVTLGADIDLSGHLWTPIGTSTQRFAGVFDGGNHQITGLDTGERMGSAGLFGDILGSVTIKNVRLTLERVHTTATQQREGAGGLVGRICEGSGGTIYNCQVIVNGTVYAKAGSSTNNDWNGAGGMVGVDESGILIDNCFINVKPDALIEAEGFGISNVNGGGFVGISVGTGIVQNSKCIMEGTIWSVGQGVNTAAAAGGFIGWADFSEIVNCYGITTPTAKFIVTNTSGRPCAAAPFLGVANGKSVKVSNSYAVDLGATYELGANSNRAAILGYGSVASISLSNCYYYLESAAAAYNGKATISNLNPVSTLEEMKKESTYTTFDFVDTWTIVPELNDGYPVLQMELTDQQKADIVTALVEAEKTLIVASETDEMKLAAVQGYVDSLIFGSLFEKAGGTAVAVKTGAAYQIDFRLGTVFDQRTVTVSFIQSEQSKEEMMTEAVSAIPQTARIVVAEGATQLQKKTAVESYVRGLLNPLDFTKANGTFTVSLTSDTTYSVVLSLAEATEQTASVTVTFISGVSENEVTLTTGGALLALFNNTAGYGQNNAVFEVKTALSSGKKLVYLENGTERSLYWSPVLKSYVGFTTQGGIGKTDLVNNIQAVDGTAESIRYGIIGTGRDNRSKIGFSDLYYFDKTVLIDDAIPEGDVERALAMDVNGDFNLSVSDLMSIIQKYVFNTEFSKATK